MNDQIKQVSMDKRGLILDDQYKIILCASLFYFRVPSGLWRDRMKKVKAAGYNCIDVYFPWNFHEIKPGVWSFDGEQDVDGFLTIAKEEGLFVMARPGPYICSEWDGGGLPAYLFLQEDLKIRDNNSKYLYYAKEWYKRILPIIAKHQVTQEGSVILLQLENELDFFDCQDPSGYMKALKNMAKEYGIKVPFIACAGQGDIYGACAQVNEIVPTVNFYLSPAMHDFEMEISYYTKLMEDLNLPLMVTETGREHLLLRRLLSSNAKLLGPYNQVAGTDFGFTTSINNWGNPVSFQTTNYNFRSMIDPFGRMNEEVYEARLLSGFINSMGEALAGALAEYENHGINIKASAPLPYNKIPALSLFQQEYCGYAIPITNTSTDTMNAIISKDGDSWPKYGEMTVNPHTSRFALFDFSLSSWGLPGKITFSSAEPVYVRCDTPNIMVFHTMGQGEVHFDFCGENRNHTFVFCFTSDTQTRKEVELPTGKTIILYGISSQKASMLIRADAQQLTFLPEDYFKSKQSKPNLDIKWIQSTIENKFGDTDDKADSLGDNPIFMEQAGLFRGYGVYKCHVGIPLDYQGLGFLLHQASDILSVYSNGVYMGTVTPAGGYDFIPLDENNISDRQFDIHIRTEIWGHSNFDDSRKPALGIQSLRGIGGLTLITQKKLLPYWFLQPEYRSEHPYEIKAGFGGWLTTRKPVKVRYYQKLEMPMNADSFILFFDGIKSKAHVKIDGAIVGDADKFNNYVDISNFVKQGQEHDIAILIDKRYHAEPSGNIWLLTGLSARDWSLEGWEQDKLWDISCNRLDSDTTPFIENSTMIPGSVTWLLGSIKSQEQDYGCHILKIEGENAKLTIFFNGIIVGRIWLPSPNRPIMAGGKDNLAYLPNCWFSKEGKNQIAIMVEAVVKEHPAQISSIQTISV